MVTSVLAYFVFYSHFAFMGVLYFGKALIAPYLIDIAIIVTIIAQIIYWSCPITILERYLYKRAKIPYEASSPTEWIYKNFGTLSPVLSLVILWSVSELSFFVISKIAHIDYTNGLLSLIV